MADASRQSQWFYARDGKRVGPLTSRELKAAADVGEVRPTDRVWKEGLAEWALASNVRGLFPTPTPDPAAAVPPPLPPTEQVGDESKNCPFCGESILAVARKCKHCGEFLDATMKKPGKAIFKASGDFLGLMCSYHIMDSQKRVLAKLKPNQSFEVEIPADTEMSVWYSCGFAGAVSVQCRAHETNRFSIGLSQMGMGCVVARVDIIDSG